MTDKPQRLWAPWRLEYIQESVVAPKCDCFLCEAVAHGAVAHGAVASHTDRERLLLHRDELTFVILNLYPYNNGHLLVAPYRHVGEMDDLTVDEMTELFTVTRKAVNWLKKAFNPNGFNIGINLGRVAGAGLPEHLHIHIVPRWDGDTNFMPVLGLAKVISQGLNSTYDDLKRAMEEG